MLACAAVLPVTLLTACSNRDNDLYTYYDEPTATTTVPMTSAQAAAAVTTTTTTARQATPASIVESASMTAADLVEEEVQAVGVPAQNTVQALHCGFHLETGFDATRLTKWRYASGATLDQYVVHAEDAVDTTTGIDPKTCPKQGPNRVEDGIPATALSALSGVDAQVSWCAPGAAKPQCTLVLAEGELATAVTVEAASTSRARTALVRVAPKAAAALSRES